MENWGFFLTRHLCVFLIILPKIKNLTAWIENFWLNPIG